MKNIWKIFFILTLAITLVSIPTEAYSRNSKAEMLSFIDYLEANNKTLLGHWTEYKYPINGSPNMIDAEVRSGLNFSLIGGDYSNLTTSALTYTTMNQIFLYHWNQGAFIMMTSHFRCPEGTDTVYCNLVNVSAVYTPGSASNTAFNAQLDILAAGIQDLVDDNVTAVIYDMFHEENGGWFWWGDLTANQFSNLWNYTQDYLIAKGIGDHIIWLFDSNKGYGDVATYYPGNSRVDLTGIDYYGNDISSWSGTEYDDLVAYGKPFGFAEMSHLSGSGLPSPISYNMTDTLTAFNIDLPLTTFYMSYLGKWSINMTNNMTFFMNSSRLIDLSEISVFWEVPVIDETFTFYLENFTSGNSNTTVYFDTPTNVSSWNFNETSIILYNASWTHQSHVCSATSLTFSAVNSSTNISSISCQNFSVNIMNSSLSFSTSASNKRVYFNITNSYSLTSNCTVFVNGTASGSNTSLNSGTVYYLNINNTFVSATYPTNITCTDSNGNTNTSQTINVTFTNTNPGITNLANPSRGQTWIYFTWTNPAAGTGWNYTMILRNGTQIVNTTSSAYNMTGLAPNTTYNISLRAYDPYGNYNETSMNMSTKLYAAGINFITPTPASSSKIRANTTVIQVNASNFGSTAQIMLSLFNASYAGYENVTGTGLNLSSNQSLSLGVYYFNATVENTTHYGYTETRRILLYNMTLGSISDPVNNSAIAAHYVNVTWASWTTSSAEVNISSYNITLLTSSLTLERVINASTGLVNNFYWDNTADVLIHGTYYLQVCGKDQNNESLCVQNHFTKNDTPPTAPTWTVTPNESFYDTPLLFSANGSTDYDNDTITIEYEVYNLNDSSVSRAYGIAPYYSPDADDVGDYLQIRAKATTAYSDSAEINFNLSGPVIVGYATFYFIREATGEAFNISGAQQVDMDIYCPTSVQNVIINATYSQNITCLFDFIKVDVAYNSSSYFRIIKPAYSQNMTILVYLLDLNLDTGVEKIITINDLTGDYSEGFISVKRYLNETEITIIKTPFDIERSVDLFLLKDQLYSILIENNFGSVRILGNLIASAAGTSTLTLPELNFNPSDVDLGHNVDWSYDYSTNGTGYISLTYFDMNNGTEELSFSLRDANGSIVFQTSLNDVFNDTSSVSITIPLPNVTHTYYSKLVLNNIAFSDINETKVFKPNEYIVASAEQSNLLDNVSIGLYWFGIIMLIVIGLSFDAKNSHIGLIVVGIFLTAFISWGFISFGPITTVVTSIIGAIAVINFITRSRKETGGD